jgi:hypothetical protein
VAVLLTWCLFGLWTAVGLAILNAGRFRGGVRKLLLAPTIGFGTLGVATYILLSLGFPVGRSAWPLLGAAVVLTAFALWRTRTTRQGAGTLARRFLPFGAVLVGAFLVTGWPLFRYGFDWIANGNDDMANYCLGAVGFREHGYLRTPTPQEARSNPDLTLALWDIYYDPDTLTAKRCGSELTLALVSSWTGLSPQQAFMPVIVAFNMALIAATAGLVLLGTRRRPPAVWAAALLTLSSQTGYGVVQQLIGQASGLALLCTSLALVTSPFRRFPGALIARRACVCGLVFAGLVVFYPEAVPFLVGACVALGVRDLVCRRPVRRHLWHAATAIVAMAVLVPVYLHGTIYFLFQQSKQATGSKIHTIEMFPYFMTPRGPALVWGLLPSYENLAEPRQTITLVLGLLLLAIAPLVALQQFRRGRVFATVTLLMMVLGGALYLQQAAFGLFKIAMFVQPFLWATVAAWVTSRRRRWVAVAVAGLLVIVAGMNARTQYWYVKQSTGHDGRVDLPVVTQKGLMREFRTTVTPRLTDGSTARVVLATDNNVLTKLLGAEIGTFPNVQLAMPPYHCLEAGEQVGWDGPLPGTWGAPLIDPDTGQPLHRLTHTPADWTGDPQDRVLLVAGCGSLSVLNRQRHPETGPALLSVPLSQVRNFAVLRDATGARQCFVGMDNFSEVALFRLEPDIAFRHRTFAGVGRAVVLNVLNPAPKVRVLANYTASCQPDPLRRGVPPAQVVGTSRVPLGAVGGGSARLVSPPVVPQTIGPSHLLVLDFNTELVRNPNTLSGIEKLWGANLPRDRRMLAGHVRDISVISEEEYAAFRPPVALAKFPDDLANPQLEYSGFFEEGWVYKEFKVRLAQPAPGQEVVIRGQIPTLPGNEGFQTELTVLIDGAPVQKRLLRTGDFEVRAPTGAATGPRWIECRFSNSFRLPSPDGREAVAHVRFVGFEPTDVSKSRPPEKLATFPADLSHPMLQAAGIDLDGWVATTGKARLWFDGAGRDVAVRGNVPLIAGPFRTEMTVLLDGAEVAKRALAPGDFEVRVPVGTGPAGPRWVECRFSAVQQLPSPDTRATAARLMSIGFEPTK